MTKITIRKDGRSVFVIMHSVGDLGVTMEPNSAWTPPRSTFPLSIKAQGLIREKHAGMCDDKAGMILHEMYLLAIKYLKIIQNTREPCCIMLHYIFMFWTVTWRWNFVFSINRCKTILHNEGNPKKCMLKIVLHIKGCDKWYKSSLNWNVEMSPLKSGEILGAKTGIEIQFSNFNLWRFDGKLHRFWF